jgi:hypothetical protein
MSVYTQLFVIRSGFWSCDEAISSAEKAIETVAVDELWNEANTKTIIETK